MKSTLHKKIDNKKKALFFVVLLINTTIFSCKDNNSPKQGVIAYTESDKPETIFPPLESKQSEAQISSQIHCTLVTIDSETGRPTPAIAKDWMINSDFSRFVFYLKDDIYFHEDEVFGKNKRRSAQSIDIVATFKYYVWVCKKHDRPLGFAALIQGIEKYYDACDNENLPEMPIDGIIFSNEQTIVFELIESCPTFLYYLATPKMAIMPHEALAKYGEQTTVGCGPYMLSKNDMKDDYWLLKRNNYYSIDTVSKLGFSKIKILFDVPIDKELQMLSEGNINLIFGLSESRVNQFMEANIERFKGENPDFILLQTKEMENSGLYIIHNSNISGLAFDDFGIIHFNKTAFSKTIIP